MKRFLTLMTMLALVALFAACPAPKTRQAQGEMDTPEHHVAIAERKILEEADWKTAHAEYQLALGLNPNHVGALMGDAVYYAHEGNAEKSEELRAKAWSNTKDDKKKEFTYYVGSIQVMTYLKVNKWQDKSDEYYQKAKAIDPENEKLYFYMAQVHITEYKWESAEGMLRKVVELNGSLRGKADALWQKVQKIVRARPGSVAAKKMALDDKITRADVAALFVEEMHLPELWKKRGIKSWEPPAFMTPEQAAKAKEEGPTASDIDNHPLKTDIIDCLKLGIRGLEVFPNGKFEPNKPITRAEYAMMLEDILMKVLNEPGLSSKYAGESDSKFHDMRTDHWAYNAAVVVSTRGIMPQDLEGNFKPMDPVAGADALLVIRQMMDYLKIG